MDNESIRPYGPGKFDTILDSFVYHYSLDGCDEEAGSVLENGMWYGLIQGTMRFTEPLTPAERRLIDSTIGVIVSENDQGFFHVEYFDSEDDLDKAWAEVLEWEQASNVPEEGGD